MKIALPGLSDLGTKAKEIPQKFREISAKLKANAIQIPVRLRNCASQLASREQNSSTIPAKDRNPVMTALITPIYFSKQAKTHLGVTGTSPLGLYFKKPNSNETVGIGFNSTHNNPNGPAINVGLSAGGSVNDSNYRVRNYGFVAQSNGPAENTGFFAVGGERSYNTGIVTSGGEKSSNNGVVAFGGEKSSNNGVVAFGGEQSRNNGVVAGGGKKSRNNGVVAGGSTESNNRGLFIAGGGNQSSNVAPLGFAGGGENSTDIGLVAVGGRRSQNISPLVVVSGKGSENRAPVIVSGSDANNDSCSVSEYVSAIVGMPTS